jgi:hypothetical protein
VLLAADSPATQTKRFTFFSETQYPLEVFFLQGQRPGPTVMVQGGIQGDEVSGYLTAELLTRAEVHRGNLIVIPRANVPAILQRSRRVNVDLNRCFGKDEGRSYEYDLARAIRHLVKRSDAFIHLHEGYGFYSPEYINHLRNPNRFGQSVIIDTAVYKDKFFLAHAVNQVLPHVNANIIPADYHFQLFNTRTNSRDTQHPEQRSSLTYFALTQAEVPAVAIEVSKNIKDLNWKIEHQLQATHKFLQHYGVDVRLPDAPKASTDEGAPYGEARQPELLVNGKAFPPGAEAPINILSSLRVRFASGHASAPKISPARGLFLEGNQDLNLLNVNHVPSHQGSSLELVADGKKQASWPVRWTSPQSLSFFERPVFVCSLNGELRFISKDETLLAQEGDRLLLLGLWNQRRKEVLNVKGYVSHPGKNDGQDIGQEIILDRQRFLSRYLLPASDRVPDWRIEIVRETKGEPESRFSVHVLPRRVLGVRLKSQAQGYLVFPVQPEASYFLEPGTYSLQSLIPGGCREAVQPFLGDWPIEWGETFHLRGGEKISLSLYQDNTFRKAGELVLSGSKKN